MDTNLAFLPILLKRSKVSLCKEIRNIARGSSAQITIKHSIKPHSHYITYFQNSESKATLVLYWETNLSTCQSGFWGRIPRVACSRLLIIPPFQSLFQHNNLTDSSRQVKLFIAPVILPSSGQDS